MASRGMPPGGMPGGSGMFAGMDPSLAAEAEKMWKQLNEMSAKDPDVSTRRSPVLMSLAHISHQLAA